VGRGRLRRLDQPKLEEALEGGGRLEVQGLLGVRSVLGVEGLLDLRGPLEIQEAQGDMEAPAGLRQASRRVMT